MIGSRRKDSEKRTKEREKGKNGKEGFEHDLFAPLFNIIIYQVSKTSIEPEPYLNLPLPLCLFTRPMGLPPNIPCKKIRNLDFFQLFFESP